MEDDEKCEHTDFIINEVKQGFREIEVSVYCEKCYTQGSETIELDPEWEE